MKSNRTTNSPVWIPSNHGTPCSCLCCQVDKLCLFSKTWKRLGGILSWKRKFREVWVPWNILRSLSFQPTSISSTDSYTSVSTVSRGQQLHGPLTEINFTCYILGKLQHLLGAELNYKIGMIICNDQECLTSSLQQSLDGEKGVLYWRERCTILQQDQDVKWSIAF